MRPETKNYQFEALLEYLQRSRGFNFIGYKRSSLVRRVSKRMSTLGIEEYQDYIDYLEVHPAEFVYLFDTILINVTGFFRDPDAWEYLAMEVLPDFLASRAENEPIRVWCAGSASGEESYTAAMILAEIMGETAFHERVKIYATDVDEEALNNARFATYTDKEVQGIPPNLLEKYFEHQDNRYIFRKDLRRAVIFGRHDLIQDAPISRVDFLICRNILMYFNSDTQAKVLARLHFALKNNGILFLGKAEMVLTHSNLFIPIDLKYRIFKKTERIHLRDRLIIMAQTGNEEAANHLAGQVKIREGAFDSSPFAQIVLDTNGIMILANERSRNLFSLSYRDIGRPFQDLEISYRPVELRSSIEKAYKDRAPMILREVEWRSVSGSIRYLDIQIVPLFDNGNGVLGVSITFLDFTAYIDLQRHLEHTNQELEKAMEELQSTNEELETTNEELQSTIEELETTNEELQSTNEELETMNEELQSTNQEMETINGELQLRNEAFDKINAFLEAILSSLHGGVIVVDNEMRIEVWNHNSEELWGLRATEVVGQNLLGLDIGLPVEQLARPARSLLNESIENGDSKKEAVILDATNRRGKKFHCRITMIPLKDTTKTVQGIILLSEEMDGI